MQASQTNIHIQIQSSPKEFDIAFASTDADGTTGQLNEFVLRELGISLEKLPSAMQLSNGYYQVQHPESQQLVVFILTISPIGKEDTSTLLKKNLSNAINEYGHLFKNKRLWIPLMGTGD